MTASICGSNRSYFQSRLLAIKRDRTQTGVTTYSITSQEGSFCTRYHRLWFNSCPSDLHTQECICHCAVNKLSRVPLARCQRSQPVTPALARYARLTKQIFIHHNINNRGFTGLELIGTYLYESYTIQSETYNFAFPKLEHAPNFSHDTPMSTANLLLL